MNEYNARDYDSFAAMDVHARSITIATLDTVTGESALGRLGDCPGAAEVLSWADAHATGKTLFAYESGPTKFDLCRGLRELGQDCGVAAVTTLARSQKQRRQKTDAVDARALLADICSPDREFSWCWVPSPEAEQARDVCRLWRGSVDDLAGARQAVSSFLLGRGFVWNERTPDAAILASLRERVESREDYAGRLRSRAVELGREERWRPYVDSISCLIGVGPETALLAAAEFDDFGRFRSGRRVRNWIGMAPTERSSGEKGARGGITKGGPSCLRKCIIEGLSSMSARRTPSKSLRKGQEPAPDALRVARKGNRRLFERYSNLVDAGKGANKAKVATAAEEACWIWRVGLEVRASLP